MVRICYRLTSLGTTKGAFTLRIWEVVVRQFRSNPVSLSMLLYEYFMVLDLGTLQPLMSVRIGEHAVTAVVFGILARTISAFPSFSSCAISSRSSTGQALSFLLQLRPACKELVQIILCRFHFSLSGDELGSVAGNCGIL